MKWIDVDKYWPGREQEYIIIDGTAYLELKSEYMIEGHESCPLMVVVSFFSVQINPRSFNESYESNLSMDGAIIYNIRPGCCTLDEKHLRYLVKIGCNTKTVRNFIEKSNFISSWSLVKRWAPLDEE